MIFEIIDFIQLTTLVRMLPSLESDEQPSVKGVKAKLGWTEVKRFRFTKLPGKTIITFIYCKHTKGDHVVINGTWKMKECILYFPKRLCT